MLTAAASVMSPPMSRQGDRSDPADQHAPLAME
jgi:hypothetical protein